MAQKLDSSLFRQYGIYDDLTIDDILRQFDEFKNGQVSERLQAEREKGLDALELPDDEIDQERDQ